METVTNHKVHDLCSSPNSIRVIKSRTMGLAGRVVRMGDMRNAYKILIMKCEGSRQFGRPRHGWNVRKSDCRLRVISSSI
jgi:hypothetical protein